MLAKLLSLLSTAKGAAAATVIATAAVTGSVAATNEDVQHAITMTVQNVTQQAPTNPSTSPKGAAANASPSGQPAVVAARNDAGQKLRAAFQDDQQTLEKLRGTQVQGADRAKLDGTVSDADTKLRARLTKALDDVAALTLGREGLEASGSPQASAKPSASPDVKVTFTADAQAKVDAIVKTAIADMAKIVADAQTAAAALPTFTPGKPSDLPSGKPSDVPGAKPSDVPGGPPSARPTAPATPTR